MVIFLVTYQKQRENRKWGGAINPILSNALLPGKPYLLNVPQTNENSAKDKMFWNFLY